MDNNSYTMTFPDFVFYKGDTITMPFEFCYPDGSPIDLRRVEVRLYLFPYGQSDMKVIFNDKDYKVAILSEKNLNECFVVLSSSETAMLEFNKYTYIPRLLFLDGSNRQYIRGEGHLIFKEA